MLTFGIEIETSGRNTTDIKTALRDNDIKGCIVKPDGTPNVDCEICIATIGTMRFFI